MNVGQILETILGLAGREMGIRVQEFLDSQGVTEIKKHLQSYFGKEVIESYEELYGKDGIIDLARQTARQGVGFKTPVFDGADFDEY